MSCLEKLCKELPWSLPSLTSFLSHLGWIKFNFCHPPLTGGRGIHPGDGSDERESDFYSVLPNKQCRGGRVNPIHFHRKLAGVTLLRHPPYIRGIQGSYFAPLLYSTHPILVLSPAVCYTKLMDTQLPQPVSELIERFEINQQSFVQYQRLTPVL